MPRLRVPIELSLAVLLIAILALVALPNFRDAQTHGRIASTKANFRTYATALESYEIDHDAFPVCHTFGTGHVPETQYANQWMLERLSSPVAYMADSYIAMPFRPIHRIATSTASHANVTPPVPLRLARSNAGVYYQSGNETERVAWISGSSSIFPPEAVPDKYLLQASGAQLTVFNIGGIMANASGDGSSGTMFEDCLGIVYDPTNGSDSFGALFRAGGDTESFWARQMMRAAQTQSDFEIQNAINTW